MGYLTDKKPERGWRPQTNLNYPEELEITHSRVDGTDKEKTALLRIYRVEFSPLKLMLNFARIKLFF